MLKPIMEVVVHTYGFVVYAIFSVWCEGEGYVRMFWVNYVGVWLVVLFE